MVEIKIKKRSRKNFSCKWKISKSAKSRRMTERELQETPWSLTTFFGSVY